MSIKTRNLVEKAAQALWRAERDATAPGTAFLATQWRQLPRFGRARYRTEARATLKSIGLLS